MIKANECGCNEKDRRLNNLVIYGINTISMMTDIIRELTTAEKDD